MPQAAPDVLLRCGGKSRIPGYIPAPFTRRRRLITRPVQRARERAASAETGPVGTDSPLVWTLCGSPGTAVRAGPAVSEDVDAVDLREPQLTSSEAVAAVSAVPASQLPGEPLGQSGRSARGRQ